MSSPSFDGWRPRVVLFDLDDTLIDSSRADSEALRRTLETFHHEFHGAPMQYLLDIHSDLVKEAREMFHKTGVWAYPPERLGRMLRLLGADPGMATKMGEYYYQVRVELLRPFPGVVPFLERLRERYPLGILSNAPSGMQERVLYNLGMADLFDAVVVAGDVGARKPDPRMFHAGLEAMRAQPGETLMVGDNYPVDVVPARRLGMHAVHVAGLPGDLRLNLFHHPSEPLEGPCDLRVGRVTELDFLLDA